MVCLEIDGKSDEKNFLGSQFESSTQGVILLILKKTLNQTRLRSMGLKQNMFSLLIKIHVFALVLNEYDFFFLL